MVDVPYRVFIATHRATVDDARTTADALRMDGVEVSVYNPLLPHADPVAAIADAIDASDAILVIDNNSSVSDWVLAEMEYAQARRITILREPDALSPTLVVEACQRSRSSRDLGSTRHRGASVSAAHRDDALMAFARCREFAASSTLSQLRIVRPDGFFQGARARLLLAAVAATAIVATLSLAYVHVNNDVLLSALAAPKVQLPTTSKATTKICVDSYPPWGLFRGCKEYVDVDFRSHAASTSSGNPDRKEDTVVFRAQMPRRDQSQLASSVRRNPPSTAPVSTPIGSVRIGAVIVSGGVVANAPKIVAGMAAGFRRCYNKSLQEHPSMSGSIRIVAGIGLNGEVLSTRSSGGEGLAARAIECLTARVSGATFSPPKSTSSPTVTIPVTLLPTGTIDAK